MQRINETLYTDEELIEKYDIKGIAVDIIKWEWFLREYIEKIWFSAQHQGRFVELDFQLLKKEYPHLVKPLLNNYEEEKEEINYTAIELLPADLFHARQFPKLRWVNLDN